MISNTLLKWVTGILLLAMLGTLAWEFSQQNTAQFASTSSESRVTEGQFGGAAVASDDEGMPPTEADSDSVNGDALPTHDQAILGHRLAVGLIGATPQQGEITTISDVPWLPSQINRSFRDAEQFACKLLVPDVPLAPALSASRIGTRRSLGRIPALTVGLEIDESAKKKLPIASKGSIQAYLRDHRLAIEPTIYESENGNLYFGTDCRAAFYEVARPNLTVKAEPMIEEAIGRFRALGVLGGPLADEGRTLLMAFRYVKSSDRLTTSIADSGNETELLFLHLLPGATPRNLLFSAFVTSNSRQTIHQLDQHAIGGSVLRQITPTITATIRFDSFVMMGMYPSEPVVTGIRHQEAAAMPVEAIRLLTNRGDSDTQLSFEKVLDRFDELSRQQSNHAATRR